MLGSYRFTMLCTKKGEQKERSCLKTEWKNDRVHPKNPLSNSPQILPTHSHSSSTLPVFPLQDWHHPCPNLLVHREVADADGDHVTPRRVRRWLPRQFIDGHAEGSHVVIVTVHKLSQPGSLLDQIGSQRIDLFRFPFHQSIHRSFDHDYRIVL